MSTRTPRETIDWLCEGDDFRHLRKPDGSVNIHRLHQEIRKTIKGSTLSQSTLARAYDRSQQATASFSDETIATLSQFFGVPGSIIRGDVIFDPIETWGMDITTSEIRLLKLVRKLTPEQRSVLFEQIRLMVPEDQRGPPFGGLPANVTSMLGRRTHQKR